MLTYGGFMLLGGRAADLLGRRIVLIGGTVLFAAASLVAGFAGSAGVLIGARLAQGLGAAFMVPAALSILTTSFAEGPERNAALGAWGGMAGLGSAVGVLAGGLLTQGPGWRWVFFVNPPLCLMILAGTLALVRRDRRDRTEGFDLPGAVLVTGGMILLVFGLARAPQVGWGSTQVIAEMINASQQIGGALGLAVFSAAATARTNDLLQTGTDTAHALTSGFDRAFLAASIFLLAAAFIALRATSTRAEHSPAESLVAHVEASVSVND